MGNTPYPFRSLSPATFTSSFFPGQSAGRLSLAGPAKSSSSETGGDRARRAAEKEDGGRPLGSRRVVAALRAQEQDAGAGSRQEEDRERQREMEGC